MLLSKYLALSECWGTVASKDLLNRSPCQRAPQSMIVLKHSFSSTSFVPGTALLGIVCRSRTAISAHYVGTDGGFLPEGRKHTCEVCTLKSFLTCLLSACSTRVWLCVMCSVLGSF